MPGDQLAEVTNAGGCCCHCQSTDESDSSMPGEPSDKTPAEPGHCQGICGGAVMDRDADLPSTIVVADLFWLAPMVDFGAEFRSRFPAARTLAPATLAKRSGKLLRTSLQSLTC